MRFKLVTDDELEAARNDFRAGHYRIAISEEEFDLNKCAGTEPRERVVGERGAPLAGTSQG